MQEWVSRKPNVSKDRYERVTFSICHVCSINDSRSTYDQAELWLLVESLKLATPPPSVTPIQYKFTKFGISCGVWETSGRRSHGNLTHPCLYIIMFVHNRAQKIMWYLCWWSKYGAQIMQALEINYLVNE